MERGANYHWPQQGILDLYGSTQQSNPGEAGLEDSHQGIGLFIDCINGIYRTGS
jgi:hypothetical protein